MDEPTVLSRKGDIQKSRRIARTKSSNFGVVYTLGRIDQTHIQLCVYRAAPDEEILVEINRIRPAGIGLRWRRVIREVEEDWDYDNLPVDCEDYDDRVHLTVSC